jgi:hypothetical protein
VIRQKIELRRQVRKIMPIFSGAGLIQDFPQAINIRLNRPRSFRRNKPLRSHKRSRLAGFGDQSNVSKLRDSIHENDVGWFDISMHEPMLMEVRQ